MHLIMQQVFSDVLHTFIIMLGVPVKKDAIIAFRCLKHLVIHIKNNNIVSCTCVQWDTGDAWPAGSVYCRCAELVHSAAQFDKANHCAVQVCTYVYIGCYSAFFFLKLGNWHILCKQFVSCVSEA